MPLTPWHFLCAGCKNIKSQVSSSFNQLIVERNIERSPISRKKEESVTSDSKNTYYLQHPSSDSSEERSQPATRVLTPLPVIVAKLNVYVHLHNNENET